MRPLLAAFSHINIRLVERESVISRRELIPEHEDSVLHVNRPAESAQQHLSPDFRSDNATAKVPGVSVARVEGEAAVRRGRNVANVQYSGFFLNDPFAAGIKHPNGLISVKTASAVVFALSRIKRDTNISGGVGVSEDQIDALQAKAPIGGDDRCGRCPTG